MNINKILGKKNNTNMVNKILNKKPIRSIRRQNMNYKFSMVGRRGDVSIEELFELLKNNSSSFNITSDQSGHLSGTSSLKTHYLGNGIIQNIPYNFVFFSAQMGLPSLELYTSSSSDNQNIRKIIHSFGWKGNVKSTESFWKKPIGK